MLVPHYPFRTLLICFATIIVFLNGCQKAVESVPEIGTSSITGVVNPPRSALKVVAVRDGQTFIAVPDVSGKFTFQNLVPGTYTISATPDTAYSAPPPRTVVLQRGQQTDIGTITMSQNTTALSTCYITCFPAGAATAVKVTNQASRVTTTFQPQNVSSSSSSFSMVIPAGTYTVSVVAAPDFQAPPDTSVTLISGKTTVFPTITLQPAAVADGGQISGIMSPAVVVRRVTIVKSNSQLQYAVIPDTTGRFSFTSIAPGTYSLSGTVAAGSGYLAPSLSNITVSANQRVDLGTIMLLPETLMFSCYIDGGYWKANSFSSSLTSSKLTVTGISSFFYTYKMILTIQGFNGTGQYICSAATGTDITYLVPDNSLADRTTWHTWSSNLKAGSGMIAVTSYDPLAETVSGTFSGTLQSVFTGIVQGRQEYSITKGAFTSIKYK